MAEDAPLLPFLSPVAGKPVHVAFDGGRLTSDAGVLVLAEIERRLGIADRLARCLEDPRDPERVRHGIAEMIRFRSLLIAAGYADANDCDALRTDPAFKMAVGRLPESGEDLCSQPTMCRLENLPGPTALAGCGKRGWSGPVGRDSIASGLNGVGLAMRGPDRRTEGLFSYVSCESRVPADHPLRAILPVADAALAALIGRVPAALRAERPALDPAGEAAAGAAAAGVLLGPLGAAADGAARLQPAVPLVRRPGRRRRRSGT